MIPLHTRAMCDACPAPATVEIDSGFFLCDSCADIVITSVSVTSGFPSPFPDVNAPTVSSPRAVGATISESTLDPATGVGTATGSDLADPPIPVAVNNSVSEDALLSRPSFLVLSETGEPARVASSEFRSGACEGNGSNADGSKTSDGSARHFSNIGDRTGTEAPALSRRLEVSDLASALSGTPGACSSEREDVGAPNPVAKATEGKAGTAVVTGHVRRSTTGSGLRIGEAVAVRPATSEFMDATAGETAPNSNSGDALGNLEPGSHTWDGDSVATAPSGRADESAISPAVAGIPNTPEASGTAREAPSTGCGTSSDVGSQTAPRLSLDFESEVSALEAEWLRAGAGIVDGIPSFLKRSSDNVAPFVRNQSTLRVTAASDSISKSVSVGA
jgi:hypothetical protein